MSSTVRNLTSGNIFKQLMNLAFPIMATNFMQMAHSLLNMAWLGRLNSESVAAVGAVGILLWMVSSVAVLTKIAAEISIAQSVGLKKLKQAGVYASHVTTLIFLIGIAVGLLLFFGNEFIISFFNLQSLISEMAEDYLRTISLALPFYLAAFTFSGIYNGIGRSKVPFYIMGIGLVCNMLLDPLLIFGFGSFEGLGIQGAAIATCIAQMIAFFCFLWKMRYSDQLLGKFHWFIRLRKTYTIQLVKLGIPVAAMNLLFACINLYMARVSAQYAGHIGLMSQTTGGQIEAITWNTCIGFSTALGAFVAQNFAAKQIYRIQKAYRYTLTMMLSLGIFISLGFFFFGENIFGLLVPEKEAMISGGHYLTIMAYSQIFMMLELITQGMFNGLGKTVPPAITSILGNLLRIPLAIYLASYFGVSGVWWAITISSIFKGSILPVWLSIKMPKWVKVKPTIPYVK